MPEDEDDKHEPNLNDFATFRIVHLFYLFKILLQD